MFKKLLFTAKDLLKVVFYLLMKRAGMVIVVMISVALAQLMQNQKIVMPAKWMKLEEVNARIIKN